MMDEDIQVGTTELVGANGEVAREVKLLPYGNPFYGRDGRGPWVLRDQAHGEQVLALTRETMGRVDMMVDYDHASELAAPEGKGRALAAGWVRELQARDDGIWAKVDWTPQAVAELAARQYRYISPYFRVHKETREVTRLVSAGLTNTPNLELPALASFNGAAARAMLTADERAICSMMGVSEGDFIATKASQARDASAARDSAARVGKLTEDETAICAMLGISQQDFLAEKAVQVSGEAQSQPGYLSAEEAEICEKMGISPASFFATKVARNGGALPRMTT